ncbi:MAG: hypothetical protein VW378_01975 [bacterium]
MKIIRRIFFSISLWIDAFFELKNLNKQYLYLYPKIKEEKFHLIFLNGDRHTNIEQVVIKIAKSLQIKTLSPYMAYSDADSCTKSSYIYKKKWYSPIIFHYLFFKCPDRFWFFQNAYYNFYKPSQFLALKWFSTLSTFPWYIGGGLLDVVCVDHRDTAERYKRNKVNKDKLVIVGDVMNDTLFYSNNKSNKEKLRNKYNINNEKKVIICSLPQLKEHHILSEKKHWEEIHFLVDKLVQSGQNILLSLHPKMNKKRICISRKEI